MKKRIALLMAIMMILTAAVCAYADESAENNNQTKDISTEANATAKKAAEKENEEVTKANGPSLGDLIRYVPVTIDVSNDEVTVEGCFVNMNDVSVLDFRDFEMDVYMGGQLLISGYFGDINSFTVYPDGVCYQSFTFMGSNDLNPGYYVCDDSCYTMTAFSFYSR